MDLCTEERAADVLCLVDCFEAIGADSHPDDYVVALSMAASSTPARQGSRSETSQLLLMGLCAISACGYWLYVVITLASRPVPTAPTCRSRH